MSKRRAAAKWGAVTRGVQREIAQKMRERKMLEVLTALHAWYSEADTGPNAYALLFDDDKSLREHIADAIGADTHGTPSKAATENE